MPQITQLAEVLVSQLFWLTIVFGFIFVVLGRGMLPKIRATVDARDQQVADNLELTKLARAQADELEADWRARLDDAGQTASRIAQEAKLVSALETEAQLKGALAQIDRKVQESRQRIRNALAAAQQEMEAVAAEAAQEMVQRLTGLEVERNDAVEAVKAERTIVEAAE